MYGCKYVSDKFRKRSKTGTQVSLFITVLMAREIIKRVALQGDDTVLKKRTGTLQRERVPRIESQCITLLT